ncbi:Phosducin-like protein 2 [Monosporozyma unispora]|nr:Phosducin-like protein 2 [Kazachstania unispora]
MFQVQVDESEDTEWNDILRAKGVIPERPPSPTQQLEEALEEALAKQHENRLEGKDLPDLEELEDDEDEDFLQQYKLKRMAEIAKLQAKAKFGDVIHISKPEYNKEVTLASKGQTTATETTIVEKDNANAIYVFVHLSSQGKLQSRILEHIFQKMAPKYAEIKFVEIPGNRAIENYPDDNCPTLLVYHNGDVLKNMITLLELGGNNTTLKEFEALIVRVGALKESDDRLIINQDDDESRDERKLKFANNKGIRSGIQSKFNFGVGHRSDDDESDDEDFFN